MVCEKMGLDRQCGLYNAIHLSMYGRSGVVGLSVVKEFMPKDNPASGGNMVVPSF
jgi:hypothetical protein